MERAGERQAAGLEQRCDRRGQAEQREQQREQERTDEKSPEGILDNGE